MLNITNIFLSYILHNGEILENTIEIDNNFVLY